MVRRLVCIEKTTCDYDVFRFRAERETYWFFLVTFVILCCFRERIFSSAQLRLAGGPRRTSRTHLSRHVNYLNNNLNRSRVKHDDM